MAVHVILVALGIGTQVDDPTPLVGHALQPRIEAGPAVGVDLTRKSIVDLALASQSQLDRDALLGTPAQPLANIVLVDHEIAAIVSTSSKQYVDMRIVGIPVIDRDPVEAGAEIGFHVG